MDDESEILELKRKLALSQALVQNLEVENTFLQREAILNHKSVELRMMQAVHETESRMEDRLKVVQIERDEAIQECHALRHIGLDDTCPTCRHIFQDRTDSIMDRPVQNTILARRKLLLFGHPPSTAATNGHFVRPSTRPSRSDDGSGDGNDGGGDSRTGAHEVDDMQSMPTRLLRQRRGSIFSEGVIDDIGSIATTLPDTNSIIGGTGGYQIHHGGVGSFTEPLSSWNSSSDRFHLPSTSDIPTTNGAGQDGGAGNGSGRARYSDVPTVIEGASQHEPIRQHHFDNDFPTMESDFHADDFSSDTLGDGSYDDSAE
uniref:Uncharacterized protein n=1 Tax=Craspedostauros australis TaxID=1486917 RepID=A0A7R9ZKX0_9STRA